MQFAKRFETAANLLTVKRDSATERFGQNEKNKYKRGNQNGDGYLSLSVADVRDVLGGAQHGLSPSVPLEDRDQNDVQNETGAERTRTQPRPFSLEGVNIAMVNDCCLPTPMAHWLMGW